MAALLVLVASGPEAAPRALEGLKLARSVHEMGMLEAVRVLLTGPGVRCLDPEDPEAEELEAEVRALVEAGVEVVACTRSLAEHRLVDAAARIPEVQPVGAPTWLAAEVGAGAAIASF